VATPATLRAVAARLEAQAAWLPVALDRVVGAAGPAVWSGPAAERFGDELRAHRIRLAGAADELRAVARRLRHEADEIERVQREQPPARPLAPVNRRVS
jgi:uncharacterized protein YukE